MQNIIKVPVLSDMTAANAGNVVHKTLQAYYINNKNVELAKEEFNILWEKYKLDLSTYKLKKDEYWLMCLNGIQLNINLTSNELKIFYPDVVAYLDGVNTQEHKIYDWKTSTRTQENEEEYKKQIMLYSLLYYKKFGVIPQTSTVVFNKYVGSKGLLEFNFTKVDIDYIQKWYNDILQQMDYFIANPDKLPKFNRNYFFSPYKNLWGSEDGDKLNFILHIYGNYLQLEGDISELLDKGIKRKFSYELKNAHWIKKARPMAKTTVEFWNNKQHILPIGFKDSLLKTIQDYCEYKSIELNLQVMEHRKFDNTKVVMPDKFVHGKILRDYQNEAVDIFMRKKIGILELATGSGKTEIAIEIIRRLGCKTLFIVDKIELLKQTKKRIEESLGIEVGMVGYGKDIVKDITVATIQTLIQNTFRYVEDRKSVV